MLHTFLIYFEWILVREMVVNVFSYSTASLFTGPLQGKSLSVLVRGFGGTVLAFTTSPFLQPQSCLF